MLAGSEPLNPVVDIGIPVDPLLASKRDQWFDEIYTPKIDWFSGGPYLKFQEDRILEEPHSNLAPLCNTLLNYKEIGK